MCLGWPWLLTIFSDQFLKTAMSQPVANCCFDHFGVSMLQQSSIQHRILGFPTHKGIVNHWSREIVSTNYQLLIFQFYSCMTAKSPLDSIAKLLDLLLSGKKRTDQQTCGDMQLCHDFNFNRPFVPWLDSIQLTYPLETSSYRYWIGKKAAACLQGLFLEKPFEVENMPNQSFSERWKMCENYDSCLAKTQETIHVATHHVLLWGIEGAGLFPCSMKISKYVWQSSEVYRYTSWCIVL